MSWLLKTAGKFVNDKSVICERCLSFLIPKKIDKNEEHIYEIGQFYLCECSKSNLWTNAIRNLPNFVKFLKGIPVFSWEGVAYTNGFCNDLWTHKEGMYQQVKYIKNGVVEYLPGKGKCGLDRIGRDGIDNPNIRNMAVDQLSNESDYQHIINWYRPRLAELEAYL